MPSLVVAAVALFPVVAAAFIFASKAADPGRYNWLIREDGPVEWLTALVYVVAVLFAGIAATRLWRAERFYSVVYTLFAGGLFLIAGEEASWGQRVFDFETPAALLDVNQKQEFNFHNMRHFPLHFAFIAVGLYGAFGRLLAKFLLRDRAPRAVELLTVPTSLTLYFLLPAILYVYFELVPVFYDILPNMSVGEFMSSWFVTGKEQEPFELILGFGFLAFTVYALGATRSNGRLEGADRS